MPQAVETIIEIDGKRVKQFSSLKLSQGIYAHHTFMLVCPVRAIDNNADTVLNEPKDLIGTQIHIKVTSVTDRSTSLFSGIVTKVEAARNNGYPGNLIISGFSPTILLDNGPNCKSWERQSVKSIAKDVLKAAASGWLQYKIAPANSETIAYMVQYKESAWQFINRLAGTYGEWLYYDGQQLVLGKQQGSKVNLTFGAQLNRFVMRMQLKPTGSEAQAHNYVRNELFNSEVKDTAQSMGHTSLGIYALRKSEQVYGAQPAYWHNCFVRNKKQLDDYVNIQRSIQSSDVIYLKGCSDQPGFQPGDAVRIKDNIDDEQAKLSGEYNIVSIEHCWDDVGNYSNEFWAIPATVKVPPIEPVTEPHCEMQSAVVVANHDELGLGRVRVRFQWMTDKERSPWVRLATPHAGNGKGIFMIPEMGEEVIVAFAGGNAIHPYIIGTVFHGKAKTEFGNAGNDIKAIQTRSGNKIIMNDEAGSIFIEDKNGNSLKLDGDGTITAISKSNIVYECGESKIEMKKDGTINIIGNKITVTANEEASIKSGQASFTADGQHNEANMEGMKSVVSGTSEVRVTSNADAKINAGARISVQSAMITLN